jgi:adenylate cyclase class 2
MGDKAETEVKIYTPNLSEIASRIAAAGGTLESPRVYERNIRYDAPDRRLAQHAIVLRLRQDTRARLTYKEAASVIEGIVTRFEAEVTVDDFAAMDLILQRLGFLPCVIYEKYRTTYRLGEAEIVLDEMPYGHFIEIEATTPVIESTLAALGLADQPRIGMSYLGLFAQVKAVLNLSFNDLTFANFEDIQVPPDVFHADH